MTTATFYFYDYETFGTHPGRDRPAQFAGVRTDAEFNPIEEPLIIYCQPPADYLPQPEATLITGITPQHAKQHGLREAEFIARIHAELARPGTCSLGYNSLRFDEEVTRHTLYRNFFDPYAHAWQNGNSRWDLLDLVRACYALRPEGIEWVYDEEGKPSFKLERLTAANGIAHENAHDAMSDVEATIALAKLIKQAQPKLFDYFFMLRNKQKVKDLFDLRQPKPLVHVSGMFSAWQGCVTWILPLAWHPHNANAFIAVNLAEPCEVLLELEAEALRERLYTSKSALNGAPAVPVKLVHINKCPILAPQKTLSNERATELGIDRTQVERSLALLMAHLPQIQEKLITLFNNEWQGEPERDVDLRLYDGFLDQHDQRLLTLIRATRPELLGDLSLPFHDQRLSELLFRYRARNWPEYLNERELQHWRDHCRDYHAIAMPNYIAKIEELAEQHADDESKLTLLKQLYRYAETL